MCGELGDGANAKIRFLQTVIKASELDSIKLISNIPGSERWDVRDLFQRDVDNARVNEEILPYLIDSSKVKFFNPLTLVILPMDSDKENIIKELECVDAVTTDEEEQPATVYERKGFFKLIEWDGGFGKMEWNNEKCNIVAIDGQHRLSALKEWHSMVNRPEGADLKTWKIPVVLLSLYKIDPNESTATLLEIVRRTFVYINKKAQQVNRARELLLDDESVTAICTQEIIRYSHENDCKELGARDESILPLIFFDWRGESKKALASIKTIEEVHDWLEDFVLGSNFESKQEIELDILEAMPPLQGWNKQNLTHDDVTWLRVAFREKVMQGVVYLLKEFSPYKQYIAKCRDIERTEFHQGNAASQFAFMKLRFGAHDAPREREEEVLAAYNKLAIELGDLKKRLFDELLEFDIGMRAVLFAFSNTKERVESSICSSVAWIEHAQSFVEALNALYKEGWFKGYFDMLEEDKEKLKIMTHLAFEESGNITNYKPKDVANAFGALLVLLVMKRWKKAKKIEAVFFDEVWDDVMLDMKKPVARGCKKKANSELSNTVKGTRKEINQRIKDLADQYVDEYFQNLGAFLGVEV
jgi:hypothetical protein